MVFIQILLTPCTFARALFLQFAILYTFMYEKHLSMQTFWFRRFSILHNNGKI